MGVHEECGVFGIFSPRTADVAHITYYGLYALQHRGQESCGITINDDGVFYSYKDLGIVSEVFNSERINSLPKGSIAVGHVRYGTTGAANRNNCQPIEVNHIKGSLAVAHNGNLSNAVKLRSELELSGAIFHTTSDTEIIAYIITRERLSSSSIEEAVQKAMAYFEGAYSLVLMSPQKLICVRDPYGFRPLCYGVTPDGIYVVASESCALNAVGAEFVRDVEPGEILIFSKEGVVSERERCNKYARKFCVFEYIYFSRSDSVIDGVSVHLSRVRAGEILAEEFPVKADMVIGAPDSGTDAAIGFSAASKIPYGVGLIKNKYIGRTFIYPDQSLRIDGVRIKLSAVKSSVKGKKIVIVDDSIVRGNTVKHVVELLREAGALEIHVRISSPPFLHPCYYGTDVDSEDYLIANGRTVKEIGEIIGADSLAFFPVARLGELCDDKGCCDACFSGEYPTDIPENVCKNKFEQKISESKKA
ncbi:MAG: amidophosphoribosyltransferase [Christensenellaceae bacterium]